MKIERERERERESEITEARSILTYIHSGPYLVPAALLAPLVQLVAGRRHHARTEVTPQEDAKRPTRTPRAADQPRAAAEVQNARPHLRVRRLASAQHPRGPLPLSFPCPCRIEQRTHHQFIAPVLQLMQHMVLVPCVGVVVEELRDVPVVQEWV